MRACRHRYVGGQIEAEFESLAGPPFALQVLIPVSAIEEIADRPEVQYLRTPAREEPRAAGGQ